MHRRAQTSPPTAEAEAEVASVGENSSSGMLGYLRERESEFKESEFRERERERENENFDGKNDDDALYNSRRKGVWPTAFFFL